jgi:hypothetical protein
VTLLGVGGAILLARLAVFQPYVVAATLVLIGVGFWYAYRRKPAIADGQICTIENRKGLRWLVWIGAVIAIQTQGSGHSRRTARNRDNSSGV